MDAQQQIFSLMSVAEDQQKLAQQAINSIRSELQALSRERAALANMSSEISASTRVAASNAIQTTLAEIATDVEHSLKRSLKAITQETLSDLQNVVRSAKQAHAQVESAAKTITLKLIAFVSASIASAVLIAYLAMSYQLHTVRSARAERDALLAEIATLRANVAELEKRGARIEFSMCGDDKSSARLCIRAATNQSRNQRGWRGPWSNDRNEQFVIPHNY